MRRKALRLRATPGRRVWPSRAAEADRVAADSGLEAASGDAAGKFVGESAEGEVVGGEESADGERDEPPHQGDRPALLVGGVGAAQYLVEE